MCGVRVRPFADTVTDVNDAIFEWGGPLGLPAFARIASADLEAAFTPTPVS